MFRHIAIAFLATILLLGCGGGTRQSHLAKHNYSRPAYQNPNYHPHVSFSHAHRWVDTTYVGGDVEPREKLRRIGSTNRITYSIGASRDGVGKDRLENYERDLVTQNNTTSFSRDGFYPFRVKPKVWLGQRFYDLVNSNDPAAWAVFEVVISSIHILNDALPPEFQIELAGQGDVWGNEGTLTVNYLSPAQIAQVCAGGVACSSADISTVGGYTRSSDISIPDNLDASKYSTSHTIIIHELLHALGIRGHVDSIEFPDSIMGRSADFFPNTGFTIHRIDREVLQIMYMSQRTANYNDWGEWSDTSLHLVGESDDGHVNFGVALFNGLPQPWARGTTPNSILGLNRSTGRMKRPRHLFGSVTWSGALLGFSGISPIAGNTSLTVQTGNLEGEQDLRFRDIYFVNRAEENGPNRWFPRRNIDYKVMMDNNGFYHSSESGHVTGVFLGPRHEGMAGTLKRTDLVGAFGGKR